MSQATALATPIPLGERIVNGGFESGSSGSLASWTTSGTVNARLATDSLNTSGGNAGFNAFFTSPFAALGSNLTTTIGGAPNSASHTISQSFSLPASAAILDYDLTISFRTVFDGRDDRTSDSPTYSDVLAATLSSPSLGSLPLFSVYSTIFPATGPSIASLNLQLTNDPFLVDLQGLLPDLYTLTFSLQERSGTGTNFTNTAAGVDDVSVTGFANPVPEPGTILLLGTGLAGVLAARRRKMSGRLSSP